MNVPDGARLLIDDELDELLLALEDEELGVLSAGEAGDELELLGAVIPFDDTLELLGLAAGEALEVTLLGPLLDTVPGAALEAAGGRALDELDVSSGRAPPVSARGGSTTSAGGHGSAAGGGQGPGWADGQQHACAG